MAPREPHVNVILCRGKSAGASPPLVMTCARHESVSAGPATRNEARSLLRAITRKMPNTIHFPGIITLLRHTRYNRETYGTQRKPNGKVLHGSITCRSRDR